MERHRFLEHIRRQTEKAVLPQAAAERPDPLTLDPYLPADLVDQFVAEVTAVSGVVHRVDSSGRAWDTLTGLFEDYEVTEFLAWDDAHLPLEEPVGSLEALGYARADTDLPTEIEARDAAQKRLAHAEIGVSGAHVGIAETGTLALQCGPGRGRHVSLLPTVHVVLLRVSQLLPSMAHYIRENRSAHQETSNLVFVTGPSRTADIEQTLTLGVHGPKELHVILW